MEHNWEREKEIHEAAHTLAHYLLRIPIATVTIVPGGDIAGYCAMTNKAKLRLTAAAGKWYGYFEDEEEEYQTLLNAGRYEDLAEFMPRADEWVDEETQRAVILDAHIIAKYAGPAASSRYMDQPITDFLSGRDAKEAQYILDDMFDDLEDSDKHRAELLWQAQKMMKNPVNWRVVLALADVLQEERTITGDRAVRTLKDALQPESHE